MRVIVPLAVAWSVGALPLNAQRCSPVRSSRVSLVAGAYAITQTAVLLARHDRWWPDPSGAFAFVWDVSPSNGQDRYLHAFAGYQISQLTAQAWDWTCLSPTAAGWLGAAVSMGFSLSKEIGDGFQPAKGFSAPDMMAATAGAALPALHRQVPFSRAVLIKFNYWPSDELQDPMANLTVASDYAGQRYYLAFNPPAGYPVVPARGPTGSDSPSDTVSKPGHSNRR